MTDHKKVRPSTDVSIETLDRVSDAKYLKNPQEYALDTEMGPSSNKLLLNRSADSWQVFKNQARAVILKNYALQSKHKGTNCCQVIEIDILMIDCDAIDLLIYCVPNQDHCTKQDFNERSFEISSRTPVYFESAIFT